MGAYLTKPKTDKYSSDESNDTIICGSSSMQGWRQTQEVSIQSGLAISFMRLGPKACFIQVEYAPGQVNGAFSTFWHFASLVNSFIFRSCNEHSHFYLHQLLDYLQFQPSHVLSTTFNSFHTFGLLHITNLYLNTVFQYM